MLSHRLHNISQSRDFLILDSSHAHPHFSVSVLFMTLTAISSFRQLAKSICYILASATVAWSVRLSHRAPCESHWTDKMSVGKDIRASIV